MISSRITRIIFLVVMITMGPGFITDAGQARGDSGVDMAERKNRMERRVEAQITNTLSRHFDQNRFFVTARVQLEEQQVPVSFENPMYRNEPLEIGSLPGLPVVPENLQRRREARQDTLIPTRYETMYQVDYMEVEVIVDNVYTQDDLNFIESRVRSAVQIDEGRGDILTVSQLAFPDRQRVARLEEEQNEEVESGLMTQDEFDQAMAEFMDSLERERELAMMAEEPEEANIFSTDHPLFFWIVAGAALLLIMFILLIYLLTRSRKPDNGTSPDIEKIKSDLDALRNGDSHRTAAHPKADPDDTTPDAKELSGYESDKMFLTNQFISYPDRIATVLATIMAEDPENGVMKGARAVQSVNSRLLSTLRGTMDQELYDKIAATIEYIGPLTARENVDEAAAFKEIVRSQSEPKEEERRKSDMFHFLHDLSDDQLFNLLKEESEAIVSIAIAQLDGDRVSNILMRMDQERRTAIMVKMGKLDNIPIQSYKQVADHLVKEAMEIANMKYVASDGVQSVLNVLDALPVSEQQGYMDTIARQDLELAEKIRRFFVSFDDIPNIDENQLQEALDSVDTETVVRALIDTSDEIVEKIVSLRPAREKRRIEAEIQRSQDVTPQEADLARKEILAAIRSIKRAALS